MDTREQQLEDVVRELRRLEGDLEADGGGDRTDIVDLDQPIGRVSRIDALQQQQMALAQKRRRDLRLRQVRSALERAGEGEFGDCASCGGEIPLRRLRARPESPLCVPCLEELA